MTPPPARAKPDADAAWAALSAALDEVTVPCAADPLFTADQPAPEDQDFMRSLCAACPLLAECHAYATAARPAAGFWAGRQRGVKRKAKATSTTEPGGLPGNHH